MPAPTPTLPATARILSVGQLAEDFAALRETFEGAHAGLYRYTPKAAMDSAFDDIASQLRRPMSALDFYRRLAPLIDRVHDSHTNLTTTIDMRREILRGKPLFPLNLRFVGERAFVERNLSGNGDIPVKGEVLAINGHTMAEILPKVTLGRSTDGFIRHAKFHAMNGVFWFHYHVLVDTSETFRIEVRDPASGRVATYVAEGVSADSIQHGRFAIRKQDVFALEFLDDGRVALMSLPTFGDTALHEKFRDAFATIAAHGSRDLIIDIRDNNGGYDEFNTGLLSYLVDRPYRFYRGFTHVARDKNSLGFTEHAPKDFMGDEDVVRLTPEEWEKAYRERSLPELIDRVNATNRAVGIHEPMKEHRFTGRTYLLVNGGSSSSGAEVPALMHFLGIGTLIGEEPNGAYQGVTAGILLKLFLPNSGFRIIVPLIAYYNAVLPGLYPSRGAPMDFEVAQTIDDALASKDTVLEFTLGLVRSRAAR